MENFSTKAVQLDRFFYLFIGLHLVLWSLLPALIRFNLPMDSIEGTIWGQHLAWGYDKNPFLNGWLTALATYLDGQSGWMIYWFSQISVVICFWTIWQLAKQMLPAVGALISVMILESVQYYNFHAIDFNDNNLELSLWALTTYFFYKALKTSSRLAWILTGLFAGLGMMTKYYTATLLAAMLIFFLRCHPQRRQVLTSLSPYLGLFCFFIIILPHIIWLFFHDFITIHYVFDRTSSTPHVLNHIIFPAQFTLEQVASFLPAILIAYLLLGQRSPTASKFCLHEYDRAFLIFIGLGPFILTVVLAIVFGFKLRGGWGMPILSLWGIMLMAILQPQISKSKLYTFCLSIFCLTFMLVSGYCYSLLHSKSPSSANFPGRDIAKLITDTWHQNFNTKLQYIAGSRWVSGNVEFYSKDHPMVFISWDKKRSPWVDLAELKKDGAVFVWEISKREKLPVSVQKRFPSMSKPIILEFSWKRNVHLPPIKIGMALLPPATIGKKNA